MTDDERGFALGPGLSPARILAGVVAALALVTVVGAVALWPRGEAPELGTTTADLDHVRGTVTAVEVEECLDPLEMIEATCERVAVDVTAGVTEGESVTFLKSLIDRSTPSFDVGDRVVLIHNPIAPPDYQYTFFQFERSTPLLLLALLFAAVTLVVGRLKGLRALIGLALSMAVVLGFLLPALIRDGPPVAVALVATAAIAFTALYVAHGVTMTTTVALIGSLASVLLITGLAVLVTGAAHLTGLTDESLQILTVTAEAIDPRGILIAGIVIGALGVLDDVTVTQVSAVAELRRAAPHLGRRQLYASAMRIGRDHVASTVNTLVLAYVGAALALMLFFFQEGRGIGQVLGQEVVAIEAVRMLVGSIGLICSVPLTTALAVWVADRGALDDGGHGHHHGLGTVDSIDDADAEGASGPSWDDFAPG